MSTIENVGEVSFSSKGVHWTIPNFSELPQVHNTRIRSPLFQFENKEWYLCIYPNGHRHLSSLDWFGIAAYIKGPFVKNECDIHLGIANEHGWNIVSCGAERHNYHFYRCLKLIPHAEFQSRKNEFMPNGTLHILLSKMIQETESEFHARVNTVEDGKERKQKFDHESQDVSTQTEEGVDVSKITGDFERMLLNECLTDVILTVQGQEFKAHRFILAARSPVFLAMMTHDTKEKATGVVDVKDGDPDIFPDFLHFLYTGKIKNLTSENALKLYTVADKYQVGHLKQKCVDYLLRNISVKNFCDVFSLSLQHNEEELKDACISFFQDESLNIIMTTSWQNFLCENPITGNELFIKHLQLIKSGGNKP